MALSSGVRYFLREAFVWGAVAATGFMGVYFFDDMRGFAKRVIAEAVPAGQVVINDPARQPQKAASGFERSVILKASDNGHFYARAVINGRPIAVMVDTGATQIALTYEDADRLGLRPFPSDYTQVARTANGVGRMAPVQLDSVQIGDVEVRGLKGSIAEEGRLHITLLGMEFIRKLERFELRGQELVLVE